MHLDSKEEVVAPIIPAIMLLLALGQPPQPISDGNGKIQVAVGKTTLDIFTYKPANYKNGPLMVVFHGVNRNADEYRDFAKLLADRHGALVIAPLFDAKKFPTNKYQQGGVLQGGKAQPQEEWTWSLVPKMVDAVRQQAGRPTMPYYLIGHSAGGQFLVRMAGFVKTDAVRIVAANPGSHLFPTTDMPFPYGFGMLPGELSGDAALKQYLAQPLTVYLGTADIVADKNFEKTPNAMKQGASRYERGHNCFMLAEKLAKDKGWTFGWRLVEAPKIAHDAKGMFDHINCDDALGLKAIQKKKEARFQVQHQARRPVCYAHTEPWACQLI
jgi:pimeloyl-ACP methyl ester carboxylesterase